jgi:hypothetical protein
MCSSKVIIAELLSQHMRLKRAALRHKYVKLEVKIVLYLDSYIAFSHAII